MKRLGRDLLTAINGACAQADKHKKTVVLMTDGEGEFLIINKHIFKESTAFRPVGWVAPESSFLLGEHYQKIVYGK